MSLAVSPRLGPRKKKTSARRLTPTVPKKPSIAIEEGNVLSEVGLSLPLAVVHARIHLVLCAICDLGGPLASIGPGPRNRCIWATAAMRRYLIRGHLPTRACLAGSSDATQLFVRTIVVREANASIMMGWFPCAPGSRGNVKVVQPKVGCFILFVAIYFILLF
jgi:hypothetical protein